VGRQSGEGELVLNMPFVLLDPVYWLVFFYFVFKPSCIMRMCSVCMQFCLDPADNIIEVVQATAGTECVITTLGIITESGAASHDKDKNKSHETAR
jgi:hypothetical protein